MAAAVKLELGLSDDDDDLLRDHSAPAPALVGDVGSGRGREEERQKLLGGDLDDDEDEDFFLTGPRMGSATTTALGGLQQQVREVTDVMRDNVGRMLDRGDRLDELHARSEGLNAASDQFMAHSRRLRKKMWWEDTRTKLAVGGGAAITIIIIIIIAAS